MRPKFDNKEEYLIAYYRQYREAKDMSGALQDIALVLVAGGFFGFGLLKGDITWIVIGFGIVAYRMLRGMLAGIRYHRVMADIIEKYEGALANAPNAAEQAEAGASPLVKGGVSSGDEGQMSGAGCIGLAAVASVLMLVTSCRKQAEFGDAAQIVERLHGHERYEQGRLKWQVHDVLGPEGPYTAAVNHDFRGSGGSLSSGQAGVFSVSNAGGTTEKKYGGVEGTSFMAIPVQNRNMQNALIICRTGPVDDSDSRAVGGEPR